MHSFHGQLNNIFRCLTSQLFYMNNFSCSLFVYYEVICNYILLFTTLFFIINYVSYIPILRNLSLFSVSCSITSAIAFSCDGSVLVILVSRSMLMSIWTSEFRKNMSFYFLTSSHSARWKNLTLIMQSLHSNISKTKFLHFQL